MKKTVLAIVATVLVLSNDSQGTADEYFVLIGVNKYENLSDLKYSESDIRNTSDELIKNRVPADHVFVIADNMQRKLQPSKENIERVLGEISKQLKPADTICVVFTGHGLTVNGRGHLCLPKFRTFDTGSQVRVKEGTSIRLADMMTFMESLVCKNKVIVFDACRNAIRPNSKRDENGNPAVERFDLTPHIKAANSIVLVTASQPGQVSRENDEGGYSEFMHHFSEGISGHADFVGGDRDGIVSITDLFQYCQIQMAKSSGIQQPLFLGTYSASIPVCRLSESKRMELARVHVDKSDTLVSGARVLAQHHFAAAINALSAGELDEVITHCNKALLADEDYAEARRLRATTYFVQGEFEKGIADSDRLEKDKPLATVRRSGNVATDKSTYATVSPGDQVVISNVIRHNNEDWVRVLSVKKANQVRPTKLDQGWLPVANLQPANTTDQVATIRDYQYRNGYAVTEGNDVARAHRSLAVHNYRHGLTPEQRTIQIVGSSGRLIQGIQSKHPGGIIDGAMGLAEGLENDPNKRQRIRDGRIILNEVRRWTGGF